MRLGTQLESGLTHKMPILCPVSWRQQLLYQQFACLCYSLARIPDLDFRAKLPGFESWLCHLMLGDCEKLLFPHHYNGDNSSIFFIKIVTEIK